MTSANRTGFGLLPLLARLVLGAACFFAGWHLCFQKVEMTSHEVRLLEGVAVVPVAYFADESPENEPGDAQDADSADVTPPTPIGPLKHAASGNALVERAAAERVAVQLRQAEWGDWSEPAAWAFAVLLLLGGGMIFLGLLTRFWAGTLAILLGVAFWLGPIEQAGMFDMDPFHWVLAREAFEHMLLLAALWVLAIGLLASGGGFWSLDSLLWRGRASSLAEHSEGD